MYGIIATWRMALEGITKAEEMLKEHADAGDAIETAIREVEDFEYYKSVGYGGLPNEEMQVELDAAYMDGIFLYGNFKGYIRAKSQVEGVYADGFCF